MFIMKPRVWIEGSLTQKAGERLAEFADIVRSKNVEDVAGAQAVALGAQLAANADFLDGAGEAFVAVARIGIGVDNVDIEAATKRGILVCNTPDAPTESTAEHTVALLLSLAKRVVRGHLSLTAAPLPKEAMFGTELAGKVLGIVGYGRIGRRVAEICGAGLRMSVLVYDPFVPASAIMAPARAAAGLDELLRQSDVVTLHSALSQETRHMIGSRELGLMKPSAYLINASRGPVVDEAALLRVLREKRIAGAALDVFEVEPPEPSNPLFKLENVVVTPHVASYTDAGTEAMGQGVVEALDAIFRGERPRNLVNPEVWPGRAARFGANPAGRANAAGRAGKQP